MMISLLTALMLCGTSPAPTTWPSEFIDEYRLKPGEVLRHIEPPFTDARQAAAAKHYAPPPNMPELKCSVMLFDDDGTTLNPRGASLGESGMSMWDLLRFLLDLRRYELLVPQETLDTRIRGDWVTRRGAPVDAALNEFSKHLSRAMTQPYHFEPVKQRTDVIVLRGRITADLIGEPPMLQLLLSFRDVDLVQDMKGQWMSYIGFFADQMTLFTGWPWIDETDQESSKVQLRWGDAVQAKPDQPDDARSPREQIEPLLKELQEQSGLDVKIETREITRWRLVVEK